MTAPQGIAVERIILRDGSVHYSIAEEVECTGDDAKGNAVRLSCEAAVVAHRVSEPTTTRRVT